MTAPDVGAGVDAGLPPDVAGARAGDDVVMNVVMKDVGRRAVDVGAARVGREVEERAAAPVEQGRRRRPAEIIVTGDAHAPGDPGRRVAAPGDPNPAAAARPDPAAVVKDHPAEGRVVVADPEPLVVRVERPVPRRDVGREVAADRLVRGHPDGAVRRVVGPGAVGRERVVKVGERARVGVFELVGVGRLGLSLGLGRRARARRDRRGRRRGRRHLGLVEVAHRATAGQREGEQERGECPQERRHERKHGVGPRVAPLSTLRPGRNFRLGARAAHRARLRGARNGDGARSEPGLVRPGGRRAARRARPLVYRGCRPGRAARLTARAARVRPAARCRDGPTARRGASAGPDGGGASQSFGPSL